MEAEPPKAEPPRRKRRWYQFSLRTLFIVVALLAVPLGYVGSQAKIVRERRAMAGRVIAVGGSVSGYPIDDTIARAWLRKMKLANPIPLIRRMLGDYDVSFVLLPLTVSRTMRREVEDTFPEATIAALGPVDPESHRPSITPFLTDAD